MPEDSEAYYKCQCYKSWQHTNKNITKKLEESETMDTCANVLSFHSKKSIGISKNQLENRGHLYYAVIRDNQ